MTLIKIASQLKQVLHLERIIPIDIWLAAVTLKWFQTLALSRISLFSFLLTFSACLELETFPAPRNTKTRLLAGYCANTASFSYCELLNYLVESFSRIRADLPERSRR